MIPQQRNQRPAPAPARERVGNLATGGQLRTGHRNGQVWVNAFVGAGVTVDVSPDEAEAFAYALLEQARQARPQR